MLFLVGVVTIIGCVLGGYVMHDGKIGVLWQPTELLIIGGAAFGSFLIGNPGKICKKVLKSFKYLMKGSPYKKKDYIELLVLIYTCCKTMKSKGMLEMEAHIENPKDSALFSKYPTFMKNHHAVHFLCDYLRIMTMGMEDYYQMDDLMARDLEVVGEEHAHVAGAISGLGDAMPALGIVAAVLGVIITMGSITEPPEILGHLIGGALVGTFLGILMAYGFFGPMGHFIGMYFHDEHRYIECIRAGLLSHLKGNAPAVTVEIARNSIPSIERPDFAETEAAINAAGESS